jgi:hypothetical protein
MPRHVQVSFIINLFPGGFSIQGQTEAHPYDRTYKDFLQCIDNGVLPAESLLDLPGNVDFTYYDGMSHVNNPYISAQQFSSIWHASALVFHVLDIHG